MHHLAHYDLFYVEFLFGFEQRNNGIAFNKALPVKLRTAVAAYYVTLLPVLLYSMVLQGALGALCHALGSAFTAFDLRESVIALSIAVMLAAIMIPMAIRFGAECMNFIFMMILFAIFLLTGYVAKLLSLLQLPIHLWVVMPVLAVVLLAVSYGVSVRWYRQKETHKRWEGLSLRPRKLS